MKTRSARVSDVLAIHELIAGHAERKAMVARTMGELFEMLTTVIVAEDESGEIAGCVALHVFWDDLAEIKCLAVSPKLQGLGVGSMLVEAIWLRAQELGLNTVFTLTSSPEFFVKCGFRAIDKAILPQKIWGECVRCPSFPICKEIALAKSRDDLPMIRAL